MQGEGRAILEMAFGEDFDEGSVYPRDRKVDEAKDAILTLFAERPCGSSAGR